MKELLYLNKYFWRYRFRFLLGVLFVTLSNVFGVFPPQVIRHVFDLVKENIALYRLFDGFGLQGSFSQHFSSIIIFFAAIVIFLALVQGLFMFLMRQTLIVMSRLIEYDLRNEVYNHYQSLTSAFYKRNKTGDLMSRVAEDVNRVRMYLGPVILYSINLVVMFTMVISTMIRVNAELTLYVLLPLPILSISIYYVNTLINRKSEAIQKQLSKLTSHAQESYSGIRVIKAYVQEDRFRESFAEESITYKERSLSLARVQAMFFPLMTLLVGLSTVLTIFMGGRAVIAGKITAGNIAEFVLYVNMLTWPVMSLGWVAALIQRAAASQKRINEFLQTKPSIQSDKDSIKVALQGGIQFDNVSFVYPDTGIVALEDLSFTLNPGEKMAIIGKTGSGKTTIAELLVRKYDASGGKILLDGENIQRHNLQSLRDQIGYVPQDVFLFSEIVRENIAFGKEDSTLEEVISAAEGAAVHKDILGLPLQYETMVGERGVTLSGGQKQRISLARALIKEPNLILLDDCLSAVDANTEQAILDYLDSFLAEKTAIIITHRIFTLLDFDKILVLDGGKLLESGTHDTLMAAEGAYYELFHKQRLTPKKTPE